MGKYPHARENLRLAAAVLRNHRGAAAELLFQSIADLGKWSHDIVAMGLATVVHDEMTPAVDYLIHYLNSGEETWRNLYLGHMLEQLHLAGPEREDARSLRDSIFARQQRDLAELVGPHVSPSVAEVFESELQSMYSIVNREAAASREIRILLVGDCLLENLVSFLTIPLLDLGVCHHHEYVTSKNPVEQRNILRGLALGGFDLVIYSPYSNLCSPILTQTHSNPNPFQSRRELVRLAEDAHRQTQATVKLLGDLFSCTIAVQNTNNLEFYRPGLRWSVKRWLTGRPRAIAAAEVNSRLDHLLDAMNEGRPRPIVRVDEVELLRRFSERELGRLFYDAGKYHPPVLAQKLSRSYLGIALATQLLIDKKVVVVDLDDTVWHGTIGEGAVEHHRERQTILRQLRLKGVLLAIASKNDPDKVHWTGGVLDSRDFVAEKINWAPKPVNIRAIASELNLKLESFVFIDDRADQRELVSSSIPEIEVLDANSELVWEMLGWWATLLPEQSETDRTQLYHERKHRETFLTQSTEECDEVVLFSALGLRADLHLATGRELARVTELTNRTNQFNTCASRTTLQQVTEWNRSPNFHVLVAHVRDKFGDMGIVSAMVLEETKDVMQIAAWVLSCRVFGYGIDTAMLNYARKLCLHRGRSRLQGRIVETPNNAPCRQVYANHGFGLRDTVWESPSAASYPDPIWLEVKAAMDISLQAQT